MLKRTLQLSELLQKKSHFLFGARSTGKTSLIKEQLGKEVSYINLLQSDLYLRLTSRPSELEQIVESSKKRIVVIDEVQKIPILLNEVHRLIEDKKITFLLTGSSSRKLVRGGVNLLGGRARKARLFPLTSQEIPDFDILKYLHVGGLPQIYLSEEPREELNAYIQTYLTEEIAAEAVVRNLQRFSRFLQKSALSNGEILNFSSIGNDLGVSPTTVREHYRILEDTLIGYMVEPFRKKKSRKEVASAKFYLFDIGIANMLRGVRHIERGTSDFGMVFEHFIFLEILAAIEYQRVHLQVNFWRTQSQTEVDFIIEDLLALEVKSTTKSSMRDAQGLESFMKDYQVRNKYLVSFDPIDRVTDGINFVHYETFLRRLWSGELFK